MATVLRKTSYNMMIYEVRDYCVGIVDPEGSILSQNFGALPIFLADLGPAIVDGVRMHGKNGFHPGDVLIMNHPYVCGQHLNNVVVYTPFFHQGELVAFLAVRAHWIDIGGTRVGFGYSGTREIYEEGLQFRSLKLYRSEQPNQDLFQLISDNVRFADSCLGDLRAQIAACRVGDRGLAPGQSLRPRRFLAMRKVDLGSIEALRGNKLRDQVRQIRRRGALRQRRR
jgi:N-methylhydantoinase B